jgi:hypothetical protein
LIGGKVRKLIEFNEGVLYLSQVKDLSGFNQISFNDSKYTGDYKSVKFYPHYLNSKCYLIAVYMILSENETIFIRQAFYKYGELTRELKDIYTDNTVRRINNNLEYNINSANEIVLISRKLLSNKNKL